MGFHRVTEVSDQTKGICAIRGDEGSGKETLLEEE